MDVCQLDRLGLYLTNFSEPMSSLSEMGVRVRNLSDPVDTATSDGKLVFNIFTALAEFQRELIRE